MLIFIVMRIREKRGAWPLMPIRKSKVIADSDSDGSPSDVEKRVREDNVASVKGTADAQIVESKAS